MRNRTFFRRSLAALGLASTPLLAHAVELYGGGGTTGGELGLAQALSDSVTVRLDIETLTYKTDFTTSGIDYDARLKATTAGAFLDYFAVAGFRLSGGALIGSRTIHGTARGLGGTVTFNGVPYATTATDTLDFDARFPKVTPYLGIGYGHRATQPGLHFYADAGVAYGRPKVTLSPSATLLARINPTDLGATQSSVQDKADDLRVYPVFKAGLIYSF